MRFSANKTIVKKNKIFHPIAGVLIVSLIFIIGITAASNGNTRRQKTYLQSAITRDITYCYATTGHYPDSLETIENKYGLTYDKNIFCVDYKILGKNIYPKITILEK